MPPRTLLLIDDDDLSREVLSLYATEAGFDVTATISGERALETLATGMQPEVILCDLQMPGLSGDSLARLLRSGAPAAALLAMSGSKPAAELVASFDGFLLKPFTMDDLEAALAQQASTPAAPAPVAGILNAAVYKGLAASMPLTQLRALYTMCLDDADRRLETLRQAAATRDADAFARAAHAIKGGCGMVGAMELAQLAGAMETGGLPAVDDSGPFTRFLAASARLRDMLDAQTE